MPRKIEISYKTIVFTVGFLIFLWFLFFIRDIILVFFVAVLIMAILNPWVSKLSRYKVPRALSVLLVYLILFAVAGFSLAAIVPPLVSQTTTFANTLPHFLKEIGVSIVLSDEIIKQLVAQIGTLPAQIARVTLSVFSNIFGVITILIFAFYLLLARNKFDDQLGYFFGEKRTKEIGRFIDLIEVKLGGWARGQLTLMLVVGLATFVGLSLLGVPFALPLSILAGLLEIVPYFGPVLSAVPAVLIGFGTSALTGFATAALYFLVQQLENYILVPKIMEKSVGVNPIITLLALAIGFRLAGVFGIIISVPLVITIQVLSKEYLASRQV
uniref:Permease n=1 Tax=uncultured Microgenomates bacterium Rifle_16ft_4_minimus_38077 TaxID=1665117 RepID=A0A0H4T6T5_9BACT|nr:hypothetical protein [uncultured Microgenomates bacterium Rifle_16ft_4_minimus_38077]